MGSVQGESKTLWGAGLECSERFLVLLFVWLLAGVESNRNEGGFINEVRDDIVDSKQLKLTPSDGRGP